MPSVCGRFQCAVLLGGLLLVAGVAEAQPAVRQVLMLHSFDRGTLPVDQFTSYFRIELERRAHEP